MTSYRELRVALPRPAKIAQLIEQGRSDHIHIATEGPIGLLVRRRCVRHGVAFTRGLQPAFPNMSQPARSCPKLG